MMKFIIIYDLPLVPRKIRVDPENFETGNNKYSGRVRIDRDSMTI